MVEHSVYGPSHSQIANDTERRQGNRNRRTCLEWRVAYAALTSALSTSQCGHCNTCISSVSESASVLSSLPCRVCKKRSCSGDGCPDIFTCLVCGDDVGTCCDGQGDPCDACDGIYCENCRSVDECAGCHETYCDFCTDTGFCSRCELNYCEWGLAPERKAALPDGHHLTPGDDCRSTRYCEVCEDAFCETVRTARAPFNFY